MRLLSLNNYGEIAWREFNPHYTPPYAILSHTWGSEEVTFQDLVHSSSKTKAGYRKVLFCGEQAKCDGFDYFWLDTCCIDKSSSAELSEAVNSMFSWYQNAARCYVYLSDVSKPDTRADDQRAWETAGRVDGSLEAGRSRSS